MSQFLKMKQPTNLKMNESYLGFIEETDQTDLGSKEEILNSLEKKGLMLSKYCGQGYNTTANMSRVYQSRKSTREKNRE